MEQYKERLIALVVKLHEIDVLKFGDYKMKSGVQSPVYFDLRLIVSYPKILAEVSDLIRELAKTSLENCDHVCGVPYAALSIATLVAVGSDKSMLVRRKEAKDHGTKRMVEGCYKPGDTCVIVEDVVTTGLSIVETVGDLQREGLKVTESIVVVDREQGGTEHLASQGLKMRSLVSLTEIMHILHAAGKVDEATVTKVKTYLRESRVGSPSARVPAFRAVKQTTDERLKMTFDARAEKSTNSMSARLLRLMATKQTNLCVAADLTSSAAVLQLADAVGPYICILKTHVDALHDFSGQFGPRLQEIAKKHNFLIMEDRKFADIGHTVSLQYGAGIFRVADWAHFVTVHPLPGPKIIDGFVSYLETHEANLKDRACFIVAEMSSKDALTTASYRSEGVKQAEARVDFVAGVVSQSGTGISSPGLIQLTPGVRVQDNRTPQSDSDGLGQQYNSPHHVILERGADVAVVGRGVTEAPDRAEAARLYRDLLWKAYLQRVDAS